MHMRLPKTKEALALHYRCERGRRDVAWRARGSSREAPPAVRVLEWEQSSL